MYKNLYDMAVKIKRAEIGILSLDNEHMDDSGKQYNNVICITMYNTTFGKEVVDFMGLKVSESRSGYDLDLEQQLKIWLSI